MNDLKIIEMYWSRNEAAISSSQQAYGAYCFAIANNILANREDSEECVNDTWLKAWNAIPPHRPNKLSAFFGRITRNLSFNKFEARQAQKRGCGEIMLALDELFECIPDVNTPEETVTTSELIESVNAFLRTLPVRERNIFLRRYWYVESAAQIAKRFGMTAGSVKASLHRSRTKLKARLEKEEIIV